VQGAKFRLVIFLHNATFGDQKIVGRAAVHPGRSSSPATAACASRSARRPRARSPSSAAGADGKVVRARVTRTIRKP
jgi:hypothetical protein